MQHMLHIRWTSVMGIGGRVAVMHQIYEAANTRYIYSLLQT